MASGFDYTILACGEKKVYIKLAVFFHVRKGVILSEFYIPHMRS